MKLIKHAALMVVALTLSPAWAVNKCTAADGRVSYQEEPCPHGSEGKEIKIHNDVPPGDGAYGHGAYGGGAASTSLSAATSGRRSGGGGHIYTGPRGGRYTITGSGNKRYIPRK